MATAVVHDRNEGAHTGVRTMTELESYPRYTFAGRDGVEVGGSERNSKVKDSS